MSRLLTCLCLAALASPVAACLNDIELPAHEREFRSQYRTPSAPPAPYETSDPLAFRLLFGAGAVMLAGATALTLTGRARK